MANKTLLPLLIDGNGILGATSEFGTKTIRLAELVHDGYKVPTFLAVPASLVMHMATEFQSENYTTVTKLADEATLRISAAHYAVRSSALAEDGGEHSHAGEFLTRLGVPPEGVAEAIADVVRDAQKKGQVTPAHPFSVIIQEFREPEFAGVLFTRDPEGGREMLLEWTKGRGEVVVSGHGGERIAFLSNTPPATLPSVMHPLIDFGVAIEHKYQFPQDIEWAVSGGELFLLQTRPVTTISTRMYAGIREVDNATKDFPKEFLYTRGTLAESFARPTVLAAELLKYVYRAGGPVTLAYRALGVRTTTPLTFLTLGNALYINKESELKQFYPTHSYFGGHELTPHVVTLSGFVRTFQNTRALARLPRQELHTYRAEFSSIAKEFAELAESSASWDEHLLFLDAWYANIFMVNVEAEAALRVLQGALKDSPVSLASIISAALHGVSFYSPRGEILTSLKHHLLGNSLNIADTTVFRHEPPVAGVSSEAVSRWFGGLSASTRAEMQSHIEMYRAYEALREEGRWLSVAFISGLRSALLRFGKSSGLSDELCYFFTLKELQSGSVNREVLEERRNAWNSFSEMDFPGVISSAPLEKNNEIYGVSSGIAHGELCTPVGDIPKAGILLVDHLDPELVNYFDRISGIIAREGGVLSHLAIVAREFGIPVVVDKTRSPEYQLGDMVQIDGGKGSVVLTQGERT